MLFRSKGVGLQGVLDQGQLSAVLAQLRPSLVPFAGGLGTLQTRGLRVTCIEVG